MTWWHTPPATCAEYHQFVAAEHNSDAVALVDDLLRLLGIHFRRNYSGWPTGCVLQLTASQGQIVDAFSELRDDSNQSADDLNKCRSC